MELTLAEILKLFPDHTCVGDVERVVAGINRDSRKVNAGEVYAAIKGENFDGHDFVQSAFDKGAVAAIVDKRVAGKNLIHVDDVISALGKIAAYYRTKFTAPVIAITGSSGKTTTKEFLSHVLALQGKVIAAEGNLNNHIGVPVTIFRFASDAKFFIVEMGMSHLEEIRYLAKMTKPDAALVTSVGRAHLEGVGGTIEAVARAKGELFEELDKNAAAFVYGDDPFISKMPTKAFRVTYGFDQTNDIYAADIEVQNGKTRFKICAGGKMMPVTINMVGRQHVQNALAVFAVASHYKMTATEIVQGLESFKIEFNRGRLVMVNGISFIDDTYNANPESMKAALDALRDGYKKNYRIAVLGGMRELGETAVDLHREVGAYCKTRVDELFVYGENACEYLVGFGYSLSEARERLFSTHEGLAVSLKEKLAQKKEAVVLVKGSRGMTMEKVFDYLK